MLMGRVSKGFKDLLRPECQAFDIKGLLVEDDTVPLVRDGESVETWFPSKDHGDC